MLLQTQIPLKKQSNNLIDYNSKLLLIGSCFSENIGDKLSYYKFQTTINPFGILFHPKAIENFITNVVDKKNFTEKDLFFHNERWHSFNTHSVLSNNNKDVLLNNLNDRILKTNQQLKETTHVVITLGTSWVYKHIKTNKIVANCHKIPQKEFSKEILSINDISKSLENITSSLKSISKGIAVIFTVSPIRHIKDGFIENMRSKSHLISAIHQSIEKTSTNTYYFPSYEIMMDELRDYRFYKEDMLHPNPTGINYIWGKFSHTWLSDEAQNNLQKVSEIQKGLSHTPFNPTSEAHQKFLKKLAQKKETLLQAFPFMKF